MGLATATYSLASMGTLLKFSGHPFLMSFTTDSSLVSAIINILISSILLVDSGILYYTSHVACHLTVFVSAHCAGQWTAWQGDHDDQFSLDHTGLNLMSLMRRRWLLVRGTSSLWSVISLNCSSPLKYLSNFPFLFGHNVFLLQWGVWSNMPQVFTTPCGAEGVPPPTPQSITICVSWHSRGPAQVKESDYRCSCQQLLDVFQSCLLCVAPCPCILVLQELVQRLSYRWEFGYVSSEIIHHSQYPQLLHVYWWWQLPNSFHFVVVRPDSRPVNEMPEEPQPTLPDGALLTIELQTSCLYALQYLLQATVMLLLCGAIDQNVIHEDLDNLQHLQGLHHLPLEDFWCVIYSER